MPSKTTKEHRLTQIAADCESKKCLRNAPHGAERLDRRNEVINEALADEIRRGEQRKNRSDGTAPGTEPAAASATTAAAAAATGPTTSPAAGPVRENPIEPDVNPKRRLLMKSTPLTASSNGEQGQKRSIPDDESGTQVEDTQKTDTGEGEVSPMKSEPPAVTTQEAVDGSGEKVMRIASVEQIELGNLMELSITGQVLKWARQSKLSGGLFLCKSDGCNLKNHSHLTVARHLRLVVTIREGEDRGLCSAIERVVENRQGSD